MSTKETISYQKWLKQAKEAFSQISESPTLDARVLLCHCLQKPLSYVLAWPERTLKAESIIHLDNLKQRRIGGEPLAYIIGEREFWSMNFEVTPAVLIPRPETELLVEWAIETIAKANHDAKTINRILELGTGSGAIAVALAKEYPELQLYATDISETALALAGKNATRNGCEKITFLMGNWFEAVDNERFELIVSNPPYVAAGDPHLQEGDLPYEPIGALVAKEKGLSDIQYLISNAKKYLCNNGWLGLEHGFDQAEKVRQIMLQQGYANIQTIQDLAGTDRLSVCQWEKHHE
ncbi:MAG: peptide chain release factor N(5)-glutamine methyltransferase [Gammaproteobacteria bacterium]|nr:peptide chain release factor N(5)-glutamine methyltransferase [Gammaproteobacteria bacterium]